MTKYILKFELSYQHSFICSIISKKSAAFVQHPFITDLLILNQSTNVRHICKKSKGMYSSKYSVIV